MRQDEINRDLKNYISVKKEKKFWQFGNNNSVPKVKPKTDEEVNLMLHGDTHYKNSQVESDPVEVAHAHEHPAHHHLNSEDKKELEEIETKIEEVDKVEQAVAQEFEDEKEGLFKKFFKKLNFSKEDKDEDMQVEAEATYNSDSKMDDEELRELLHGLHNWIIQLPSDKLEKFKSSKEFELYTNYLRKHNLIK